MAEAPLSAPAVERARVQRPLARPPTTSTTPAGPRAGAAAALGAVLGVAVLLRFATTSDLWLDEALSVNIAQQPLSEIPGWLRHDGAPPLYYLVLNGWTAVFGTSDFAVRSLSGVLSVATLPAMYYAGRRLGGPSCAWAAVMVTASSSFAVRFATEARMYSLVALLVALGYLALARALERPGLGRLAALSLVVAALLYTQYWSLYLLAVTGALLVLRAWRARGADRRAACRVIAAVAAGGLAFLPWVPTLLYQSEHIRASFGTGSGIRTVVSETLFDFSGGMHAEAYVLFWVFNVLLLIGVLGVYVGSGRIEPNLRARRGTRIEALAIVVTLLLGAIGLYVTGTVFYARYASVIFPLFVLIVANGVAKLSNPLPRTIVLVVIVVAGFAGGVRNIVENRTEAERVSGVITREARPGDVVAYCPDMVAPAVSRQLEDPSRLRQVTFPTGGPDLIDWVDYIDRHAAADPARFADRVLDAGSRPQPTIWYVMSSIYQQGNEGKCESVRDLLGTQRNTSVVVTSSGADLENLELFTFTPR